MSGAADDEVIRAEVVDEILDQAVEGDRPHFRFFRVFILPGLSENPGVQIERGIGR
ncbi:hypothetical protein D3C72_2534720 [compost metagenome]